MHSTRLFRLSAVLAAALLFGLPAHAQDQEAGQEKKWSDTAELSLVGTSGNAESLTFGFNNDFKRFWEKALLEISLAGIRAENTKITRTAFGDPTSFAVQKDEQTEKTAETYLFRTRYQRDITDRFFWYGAVNWDRNRPAGIQNRYIYIAGVGNTWYDTDDLQFKTDYAVTYTNQKDVVVNPLADDTFAGLRVSWDYLNRLTSTTVYENTLVVDLNLDETSDLRVAFPNSVTVTMSESLALKAGLTLLYDGEPSFESVPLFDVPGPGGVQNGTVPVQLDELDTIYSISLVVNF